MPHVLSALMTTVLLTQPFSNLAIRHSSIDAARTKPPAPISIIFDQQA